MPSIYQLETHLFFQNTSGAGGNSRRRLVDPFKVDEEEGEPPGLKLVEGFGGVGGGWADTRGFNLLRMFFFGFPVGFKGI